MQFVGLRILDTFLQQWDPESKRELIVEMTSTSEKAVPTLIHMLRSTFAGDEFVIRPFAASVIAELTGNIKISEFPGMVKLISSLLDAKNQQDSLPPTEADIFQAWYSPKLSEFPGVVKLISSFLDPENQQNSLLNVVPKNNGGSQSICNTDESAFLQRMLCPLMGMSLLQKLAGDPDNCAELVEEASYITTKTLGLIIYLTSEEICGDQVQNKMLRPTLNFAGWLASNRGKIGARFCQELSENPFLLNSLKRILDLEDCQPELWKLAIDIIAKLALDEAASQEIGSTQSIIHKLMQAFLMQDDVNPSRNNDRSLQMAAGEALVNLTIKSTDNCWAILLAKQGHNNLLEKLTHMIDDEYYRCVAAKLLHNLCANSRDKLMDIDFGAKVHLESALPKVSQLRS
jgi:hypothetical protein